MSSRIRAADAVDVEPVAGRRAYECRHVIAFEDTNLVGNVYYANFVRWQGRCRELFLRDYAPGIVADLDAGLALVTTRVSCEYFAELRAFDEVRIEMRLAGLTNNRITMTFDYHRVGALGECVARGEQQVACMRRADGTLTPTPVPAELRKALESYA